MANGTNKDSVFEFIERVDDPRNSVSISNAIDQFFVNASPQTLTQSEQLESISNVRQFGDIASEVIYMGLAVFFTLLLVIGTNLAQSVQERIREFALFRTLGFSRVSLSLRILQESLLQVSAGGTEGLLLGYALTRYLYPDVDNVLQTFGMTWDAVASGIVLTAAFSTLAAQIPA
jgi:putative ABC transport system permease protein